jgi:hypothetical protein
VIGVLTYAFGSTRARIAARTGSTRARLAARTGR